MNKLQKLLKGKYVFGVPLIIRMGVYSRYQLVKSRKKR